MKRRSRPILTAALLVLLLVGFGGGCYHLRVGNDKTFNCKVIDKYIKRIGKADVYMVVVETDGETIVLRNSDEPLFMKFNSSDVYARLRIGEAVSLRTVGYRFPLLSWYPRIIEVK